MSVNIFFLLSRCIATTFYVVMVRLFVSKHITAAKETLEKKHRSYNRKKTANAKERKMLLRLVFTLRGDVLQDRWNYQENKAMLALL